MENEEHLGCGIHASYDEFHIVLRDVGEYEGCEHRTMYLEPDQVDALLAFIARIRKDDAIPVRTTTNQWAS